MTWQGLVGCGGTVGALLAAGLLVLSGCTPAVQEDYAVTAVAASDAAGDPKTSRTSSRTRKSLEEPAGAEVATAKGDARDNGADRAAKTGRVTEVVDGDTIEVDGFGTIRLIGIDAPERGECGYSEATWMMQNLVLGSAVALVPGARDNRDRYGRLLRYVDVGDQDAGRALINGGLAIARYDSRDGYGRHTREDRYVAVDAASHDRTQEFCAAPPPPAPAPPAPAPRPLAGSNCDPSYPGVCIPAYPPDLDCPQIAERRFDVVGPDPHGFDGDRDGVGCES